MTRLRLLTVLMLGLFLALSACQGGDDGRGVSTGQKRSGSDREPLAQVDRKPAGADIDWAAAPDCPGKLRLLRAALAQGRIADLDGTPFALISGDGGATPERRWITSRAGGRRTVTSSGAAARCVIRLAPATDYRSDHQVLDREQVRSEYRSGSRMEKNPAYDVAQARLRQAERAAKPAKSSIIKVGDPLIDLVGTLVGGALTGIGQWGVGDELEAAIDQLTATPRSIEQPTFRTYQFERSRVRAFREATVPIILTDRELAVSWRTRLRRRETREFSLLAGLDRQDRAYDDHRRTGITEQELRRWQAEIPIPPLDDIVASLLDGMSVAQTVDRVVVGARDDGVLPEDVGIDAAALPSTTGSDNRRPDRNDRAATGAGISSDDRLRSSVVRIFGADKRGQGVYVAPRLVLTTSDLVEGRGLVDVGTIDGRSVMGLVARVDRSRGLALVQVPRSGPPVALFDGPAADRATAAARGDRRFDRAVSMRPAAFGRVDSPAGPSTGTYGRRRIEGHPVFRDDDLVGLTSAAGGGVDIDAIRAFLADQKRLFDRRASRS